MNPVSISDLPGSHTIRKLDQQYLIHRLNQITQQSIEIPEMCSVLDDTMKETGILDKNLNLVILIFRKSLHDVPSNKRGHLT